MKKVGIIIEYDLETGDVHTQFPNNTVVALGMIEMAKNSILNRKVEPEAQKVIIPEFVPPTLIKGGR